MKRGTVLLKKWAFSWRVEHFQQPLSLKTTQLGISCPQLSIRADAPKTDAELRRSRMKDAAKKWKEMLSSVTVGSKKIWALWLVMRETKSQQFSEKVTLCVRVRKYTNSATHTPVLVLQLKPSHRSACRKLHPNATTNYITQPSWFEVYHNNLQEEEAASVQPDVQGGKTYLNWALPGKSGQRPVLRFLQMTHSLLFPSLHSLISSASPAAPLCSLAAPHLSFTCWPHSQLFRLQHASSEHPLWFSSLHLLPLHCSLSLSLTCIPLSCHFLSFLPLFLLRCSYML